MASLEKGHTGKVQAYQAYQIRKAWQSWQSWQSWHHSVLMKVWLSSFLLYALLLATVSSYQVQASV